MCPLTTEIVRFGFYRSHIQVKRLQIVCLHLTLLKGEEYSKLKIDMKLTLLEGVILVKFWPLLLKLLCCPSLQYVELIPLVLFNLWMKIFEHMRCVLLVLSIKYTTRPGQCANLHFKFVFIFKVWYGAGLHWPATDAVGEELHIQGRFRHIQGRCQDSGSSQSRFKWAWNIGAKEDREHRCEGRSAYYMCVIVTFTSSQARSMVKDPYGIIAWTLTQKTFLKRLNEHVDQNKLHVQLW